MVRVERVMQMQNGEKLGGGARAGEASARARSILRALYIYIALALGAR